MSVEIRPPKMIVPPKMDASREIASSSNSSMLYIPAEKLRNIKEKVI